MMKIFSYQLLTIWFRTNQFIFWTGGGIACLDSSSILDSFLGVSLCSSSLECLEDSFEAFEAFETCETDLDDLSELFDLDSFSCFLLLLVD